MNTQQPDNAKPATHEAGQNPAADADTLPVKGPGAPDASNKDQGGKPPTPNEVMHEEVSPQDEQGNRPASDQPHIGG